MKTIGLIGGMSWESSIEYYRIINETMRERLGGLHSARSVMCSVDFEEIEELQNKEAWDEATDILVGTARQVERGGADFLLICTNTMHLMADDVQKSIGIPLLHIDDATADKIKAGGMDKIGLLGTKFTMEKDFYRGRLEKNHGLEVLIPSDDEREVVHRVIYEELCMGIINPDSKKKYDAIMKNLITRGVEAIILGCTEIGLLVKDDGIDIPLFDTARIHAIAAVEYALS